MLYLIIEALSKYYHIPGSGMFRYITFRAAAAAITALIISFWFGPIIIRKLREHQIGELAKVEAPKTHLAKVGTPTMGGLIILLSILVPALLWGNLRNMYVILIILTTVWLGAVGFLDDYLKVVKKKPKGLIGRYKIVGQVSISLLVGGIIYFFPQWIDPSLVPWKSAATVPFIKHLVFDFQWFYIGVVVIVITATSNAVNLTDGLDGLAIMPTVMVAGALAIFAYVAGHAGFARYLGVPYIPGSGELAVFCGALVGAGLGFLWFNAYPAEVFMGDVGALALGAALGMVAVVVRQEIVLFIMGGLFVAETLSVMVQVVYFRLSGGKRIFRMAPLHHHYELGGWKEPQVVVRFWIITILLVLFGLSTLKLR